MKARKSENYRKVAKLLGKLSEVELLTLSVEAKKMAELQKQKAISRARKRIDDILKKEGVEAGEIFKAKDSSASRVAKKRTAAPRAVSKKRPVKKAKAAATPKSIAKKGRSKMAGVKVPPKFRDGSNVWSGRGQHPRWLRERLNAGHTLDEYRI